MTSYINSAFFSFYGFCIKVESSDQQDVENIRRDFSFFLSPTTSAQIKLEIFPTHPGYCSLPNLKPSLCSPRNFCYRHQGLLFVDYFGKGLSIINTKTKEYKIYSADTQLRHEIVFLTILSLVGENLDSRRIHRVHALGIEIKGKAVLILLPQGGGKTTLMLELLKHNDVKLISEDTPLLNPSGEVLPFPIRIGIDAKAKLPDLPKNHIRLIERMEFGPKYLVDIECFEGKIAKHPSKPAFIIKGIRCLGAESRITPASRLDMLKAFIVNTVIGMGVYQGIEFIVQHSPLELIKKSGVAFSRLNNSYRAISRAKNLFFYMGGDIVRNSKTLIDFLNRR